MSTSRHRASRVAVFGPFGINNLGNESTLGSLLYHLRRFDPDASVTCICVHPKEAKAMRCRSGRCSWAHGLLGVAS